MSENYREKGNRLDHFVSDYVVFDLETTDKYVNYAEIIEISAIRVRNNEVESEFSTLVMPEYPIPASATQINNITNEMVVGAPALEEALTAFDEFIGDDILVGHNINTYDLNILYDCYLKVFDKKLQNDFLDTLYISRRCFPELDNHRLTTISESLKLNIEGAHRALADCVLTNKCYQAMMKKCQEENIDISSNCSCGSSGRKRRQFKHSEQTLSLNILDGFLRGIMADGRIADEEIRELKWWMDSNEELAGNYPFDVIFLSLERVLEDGIITDVEREKLFDLFSKFIAPVETSSHECICSIEGTHCCVTGDFDYGTRKLVEAYIESKGGIIDSTVKNCTEYVIVGNKGSEAWAHGNYGNKVKKAMELKEKGHNIEIVQECDFFKELEV